MMGATIRPATSSMTMMQTLLTKTIMAGRHSQSFGAGVGD